LAIHHCPLGIKYQETYFKTAYPFLFFSDYRVTSRDKALQKTLFEWALPLLP
jgi:hypothetical protein